MRECAGNVMPWLVKGAYMTKIMISAIGLASLVTLAAVPQTTVKVKHHVVFQLSEPKGPAWEELTAHVNNLLANFVNDGGAEVEIVFLGPGLSMLRKTNVEYARRFRDFLSYGVTFAACQNSMAALKLTTQDLFPFTVQVRSGVAEVVRKQEAGWAYIH
jgi:intracellular sulfur oxidation DsrE/DsrF family protein